MAVIALSAREALFEYQDNSMSVLLAHGSRVFLAGDAEKKAEEYMANGSYTGPLAIIGFCNYKTSRPAVPRSANRGWL